MSNSQHISLELLNQREEELKMSFAVTLWKLLEKFDPDEQHRVFQYIVEAVDDVSTNTAKTKQMIAEMENDFGSNVYLAGHC